MCQRSRRNLCDRRTHTSHHFVGSIITHKVSANRERRSSERKHKVREEIRESPCDSTDRRCHKSSAENHRLQIRGRSGRNQYCHWRRERFRENCKRFRLRKHRFHPLTDLAVRKLLIRRIRNNLRLNPRGQQSREISIELSRSIHTGQEKQLHLLLLFSRIAVAHIFGCLILHSLAVSLSDAEDDPCEIVFWRSQPRQHARCSRLRQISPLTISHEMQRSPLCFASD